MTASHGPLLTGKIHSIESFGTVDGPGIRFVAFLQGCPLRCSYCHNPDTWDATRPGRYEYTPQQLLSEALRYKSFIARGGVTLTGGEPLMQASFCREYFRLCREEGIHTALDTAGSIVTEKTLGVLDFTDLVLLDIKAFRTELCRRVCGSDGRNALAFLEEAERRGTTVWIRHVVVPGLTDDDDSIAEMMDYLKSYRCIDRIEWLPYHTMGVYKYEELNLPYPLEGVAPLSSERINELRQRYEGWFRQ